MAGLMDGLTPHQRYRQSKGLLPGQFDRPSTEEGEVVARSELLPFGIYRQPDGSMRPGFAFPHVLAAEMPTLGDRSPEAADDYGRSVVGNAMLLGAPRGILPAPSNAVGTFGGRLAKTADQAALAKAEELAAKGTPREQIWNETGWFQGPDKNWRFEIDDSAMSATKGDGYGLRGHLRHDQLADAYPQSASLPTSVYSGGNYGLYDVNGIEVRSYPQNYRSYAAHELQHFVQDQENFARGQGLGNYRRGSDEVEARAVQKRMDYTPEERRARHPWLDYDVPEDQQIVRFK